MTIPSPPSTVPECGIVQPDGVVTVRLTWTPGPGAQFQDVYGWELGAEDTPEVSIFGASFTSDVNSFEVRGLTQGQVYFWKVITDGDTPSEIAWFKAKTSGPPPPPTGGGIPMILILAAGGLIVFLIASKKLSPEAEAAAVAIPFIPP
jgi:hypothetical protein